MYVGSLLVGSPGWAAWVGLHLCVLDGLSQKDSVPAGCLGSHPGVRPDASNRLSILVWQ